MTDTGEVVREESPMGLISVRETAERATSMAVSGEIRNDLLETSAVVPTTDQRIDDPRDVLRLRLRVGGADLSGADLQGAGQSVSGDIVEISDARMLRATATEAGLARYLQAEPFIESDDPGIRAEADRALAKVGEHAPARQRAEALTRYVNALLDKKPTVSLPSAREVLRTRIGDCNEHTALYVAMARAAGIPARIAVGLTFTRGAFYYHAWPEVYLNEGTGGLWMPVDPTLNQFPADATHLRLARGGLAEQAKILPLVGRLQITILDLELSEGARPILVGSQLPTDALPTVALPIPQRGSCDCWCGLRRRR
jgi:transglutaminase-like putative cysteine protease